MIDLDALERTAHSPGESAVVSKRWLLQALSELREGRQLAQRRTLVFDLPDGKAR